MKKFFTHFLFATAFLFAFSLGFGQADCVNGRYLDEVFPSASVTSGITFGNNTAFNGVQQDLLLDVYEPDGDNLAERPVIILSFGGSFIGGSRTGGDVVPLAQAFAKRGYVVISHDYRLGMDGLPFPGPDSTEATQAVLRGVHDAKAAVRWVRKESSMKTKDRFIPGIDPGSIA